MLLALSGINKKENIVFSKLYMLIPKEIRILSTKCTGGMFFSFLENSVLN